MLWVQYLDPLHREGYQFWSGIGSGSPLIAGALMMFRKHNCHVRWCPRIQFRPHPDDEGHLVCRRHYSRSG